MFIILYLLLQTRIKEIRLFNVYIIVYMVIFNIPEGEKFLILNLYICWALFE